MRPSRRQTGALILTELSIPVLGLILVTACLVALLTRRLDLPYSTGLVGAGIALGFVPEVLEIQLSRELIFTVFLPPLIFEAALQLDWRDFRRALPVTLLLAVVGVVVAALVVALGSRFAFGWSWIGAGLFGVLIAATDPVSVIAAFKEMRVEPRLSLLVEAESLLNDGVAAVGFAVLVSIAAGGGQAWPAISGLMVWTVLGGIAVGAAVAGLVLFVAGRTEDHLVEITLTTIAAYGSFLFAERLGMSGVLATLTAGLVVGNQGWKHAISEGGRPHVLSFWEFAAFLTNSIVFILIGGQEAHRTSGLFSGMAAIAIGLTLLGRVAAVYPLCLALRHTRHAVSVESQHVLFWGGLRGALALALALALPDTVTERPQIIMAAFAVVAFSVFVQGLTMPWLIRRLGFAAAD